MDTHHTHNWAGYASFLCQRLWSSAEFNILVLKRQFKKEQSTQTYLPPPSPLPPIFHFLYLLFSKR